MHTTQEQILERLKLLPESMLKEVLLFVDFLLSRLKRPTQITQPSTSAFAEALSQFRAQVEAEGSDIEETDFFTGSRDFTLTSEKARW